MLVLAKSVLDFGLQSDNRESMTAFWQEQVGLALDRVLPVFKGVDQYRFGIDDAVLKVNMMDDPLPAAPPTGYRELWIPRPGLEHSQDLRDPDGNQFSLVPPDHLEGYRLGLCIAVSDLSAFTRFYTEALGLIQLDSNSFACGKTKLMLRQTDHATTTADDLGRGFRYITIQVKALDKLHQALVDKGVVEHMAPSQWSDVAYVSFIRDPDNNLIELSQRAELQ